VSFGPLRWREGLPNRNPKARDQRPTALTPETGSTNAENGREAESSNGAVARPGN